MPSTLLHHLARQRGWQTPSVFQERFTAAATTVAAAAPGPTRTATPPSETQMRRWFSGRVDMPHRAAGVVLAVMFSPHTIEDLFTRCTSDAPCSACMPSAPAAAYDTTDGHVISGDFAGTGTQVVSRAALPAMQAGSPTGASFFDVPLSGWNGNPDGSQIAALGEEITLATSESARFNRQARGTVDATVIAQLTTDVEVLASRFLIQPPYQIFTELSTLRRDVFDMLHQRQRPTVLPDLYRFAGQLSALIAHASLDLGHPYAADSHARTAWVCADYADDDLLRAYTRWIESQIAYWGGDYRTAAEIAEDGQDYPTPGTSGLRLASQAARAWAAAGDQRAVEAALSAAAAASEVADPAEDRPGGVFRFDRGKALYYASEVRTALGGQVNLNLAIRDAGAALSYYADQPSGTVSPEFVAAARLDGVAAHIALESLDAAEEVIAPVFALPAASRTVPIARRMQDVGTALDTPRFANSPVAARLLEQVESFGVYTAVRALP